MLNDRSLLKPVKREDFIVAINSQASMTHLVSPETYFVNQINEIKKFAVGPYFWFIANLTIGSIATAGGMVEEIISIKTDAFVNGSPDQLFKRTHPDDIQQMFAFTNYWIGFLMSLSPEKRFHVHPSIYVRLKNKEEIYKWVMVQYVEHIFDERGEILLAFTLVTDISFLKKEGPAMMSILDTSDETCQHFYCIDGRSIENTDEFIPKLTVREIEVIGFLAIGYSSKQIAAEMKIATNTVDNHRQSMLRKTNSKSTGELVNYAIKSGFV
ncbi:MAG: helix-turn-helix transcriptional regulator [Ferruginibacter sp.]